MTAELKSIARWPSWIRLDEVLVLQGAPVLGAVFAIGHPTTAKTMDLAILATGSFCLVAHVFVLNDWSGMDADSRDPNRTALVSTNKGAGRRGIFYLSLVLLAMSLLLLSPFGLRTLPIALAIALLSALYSAPAFHFKGVPLLSSALHLAGGLLHFLLGYSVFRPLDGRGWEIGCYFGLAFAAGHLTHEVRDHDADLLNGIRTNAVTFGKAGSFAAAIGLFATANVLLFVLAARGTVPHALVFVAVFYYLHLDWSLRTLRAGLNFKSIRRLQVRYRALYAIVGLTILVTVLV